MGELHCGRAEEQPGCDLVSVGNMTTEGRKKKKGPGKQSEL